MEEEMQNQAGLPADPLSGGMQNTNSIDGEWKKQDIKRMMSKIDSKILDVEQKRNMRGEKIDNTKRAAVQQVFQAMKAAGVDMTNMDDISRFLQKLEKQNPDLVEIFTMFINSMYGKDPIERGQKEMGMPMPADPLQGAGMETMSTGMVPQQENQGPAIGPTT